MAHMDSQERNALAVFGGIVGTVVLISVFVYSQDHNPLGVALLPLEFLGMAVYGYVYPKIAMR
jgi:hypothetical protein